MIYVTYTSIIFRMFFHFFPYIIFSIYKTINIKIKIRFSKKKVKYYFIIINLNFKNTVI